MVVQQVSGFVSEQEMVSGYKDSRACFNFLGKHNRQKCESKGSCQTCGERHHTLLHKPVLTSTEVSRGGCSSGAGAIVGTTQVTPESDIQNRCRIVASSQSEATVSGHCNGLLDHSLSKVRLKVVPVTAYSDEGKRSYNTYAFLDEGSDTTLCTTNLMDRLGV